MVPNSSSEELPTLDTSAAANAQAARRFLFPSSGEETPTLPPNPGDAASEGVPLANQGSAVAARVPGYELLSELGRGSMGVVYKARHIELNRVVALKMILAGGHASEADLARFRGEARAIAQIQHPNIVQIYEVGEQDGLPFFSLEYCSGGSLDGKLSGPLPPRQSAELVKTLANAIHAAHRVGIIHRDLKPANVLLLPDGTAKITDFGLAKKQEGGEGLTQSGAIMGTPRYMAPEQASGQSSHVTTLADVYALGAILYQCLTGRPPFQAATTLDTILQVLQRDPESPSTLQPGIPQELELVCLKCLSKEPAQRYPSADALAADLDRWLAGEPVSVKAPSLTALLRLWLRKNFGAAAWTIPIGLASGLFMALTVMLFMIQPWFHTVAGSYETLTGANPTWLLFSWSIPGWLQTVMGVLALLGVGTIGLIVAWLVRPLNRQSDIAAGLITGLIGAVTLFTLSFGWFAVLTQTWGDRDVRLDLRDLAEAAWSETGPAGPEPGTTDARDRLLKKYPRLHNVPVDQRGRVLTHKIACDLVSGVPWGLWLGMLASVVWCVPTSVGGTMAAGRSLRSHGRTWKALPCYFEFTLPLALLCGVLFILLVATFPNTRLGLPLWYVLGMVVLGGLSVTAVQRRWRWPVRVLIHAGWIASMLAMGSF
jgi:hypothetical protein